LNDTTPPSAPLLSARALRFDKVTLSWEPATDDVAVKGYRLFRDGAPIAELEPVYLSWIDLKAAPDREYRYTIAAVDEAGNVSVAGNVAAVSTKGFVVPDPSAAPAEATPDPPARPAARPAPKPGNVAPQAAVTASSEFSEAFGKANAVDHVAGVHESGEWASKGEAKPWIRLQWPQPRTLRRIVLYDRPNMIDHASAGLLTFSDGSRVEVSGIPNDGSAKPVEFPAKTVTWVKFEVTASSGQNVGLSEIEAFEGTPGPGATPGGR
jgi:hypothetical protein